MGVFELSLDSKRNGRGPFLYTDSYVKVFIIKKDRKNKTKRFLATGVTIAEAIIMNVRYKSCKSDRSRPFQRNNPNYHNKIIMR